MRIIVLAVFLSSSLAASVVNAQANEQFSSLQVGSATLFGQEFSLNFCQGTMDADVQCLNDIGIKIAQRCRDSGNDGSLNSHTCDPARMISCQMDHWRRKWTSNWTYWHARGLDDSWPRRYRIDFANGSITEITMVGCRANGTHSYALWHWGSQYYGRGFPMATLVGFANHVRPAFARGTVIADDFATPMTLRLEQFASGTWSTVSTVSIPRTLGLKNTYEVTGYVEPTADVRLTAVPTFGDATLFDVRLFVEQCVPDASRPGQCLGDP